MAKSETILGRKQNRRAFHWAGRNHVWFTVSTFTTRHRKRFYSDAITHGLGSPRPSVLYRIRIYPKPERF